MEHESDSDTNSTGALGTIPKGLVKGLDDLEIRGQAEAIQTTVLSRLARILRRDLRRLAVTQIPLAKAGVKNSQKNKIIIILSKQLKLQITIVNTSNLNSFKYFYLIQIIYKQIYLTH